MNIVRENIGNLNEHITVELAPADYQEAVEKTLKDLRRRANIPGFRAGHVPMGMIERQYKPSVMVDEISKLVNDNVEKYLKDKDIQIIFEPLAVTEKTKGDFTKGGDFSFTFEIGLRPEIVVDYAKAKDVPYMKVVADEQQVDAEVEKLRRRLGKFSSTEEVLDGDMTMVTIDTGVEGAEKLTSSLPTSYFKKDCLNLIVGRKIHDTFELDTKEMLASDYERATLLKRKPTELEDAPVKVTVSIDAIHHVEPADLDEEFFSRAFPEEDVKDEAAMRLRLKEQIERGYESQEKMQYRGVAMEALTAGMDIALPDDFVKRYLMDKDPANYTEESMTERYPDLQKSICFQLVENRIATDGNVNVTHSDVLAYLRDYAAFNYMGRAYESLPEESRKSLDSLVDGMLKQEKTVGNVYDNIYFERITDVIFEKSGGKRKEVSIAEFYSSSDSAAEAPKAKKTKARKPAARKEEKEEPAAGTEAREVKPKKTSAKKSASAKGE